MFWLGFLFGDENRKLKELEQRKKDRQAERDREVLGFMVEELRPQLDFMKKNTLESLTFTLLDTSKFNYSLLSQALSKIGSKIAYTRLEKFEGNFFYSLSTKIAQKRFLGFTERIFYDFYFGLFLLCCSQFQFICFQKLTWTCCSLCSYLELCLITY